MNNFKVIKCVLQNYISMEGIMDVMGVGQYSAEGLYYREEELQRFTSNVVMKLW
jgi:hypothetical protein